MTAAEAIALLSRVRAWVRSAPAFTDRAADERNELFFSLVSLESALAHPTSLCTRDQIVDAVVCADCDETEGPSLLDELLEQISTEALKAELKARPDREDGFTSHSEAP